ncbi:MAG: regulatory protein RecX [Alphaproteobacteria bacterium]|nr:recombination regulator RecX [Alphaproteobacteria bacterium]MDE2336468.1 regulatory protein RecX [Alphaproteobacteria bacterium]
MDKKPAEHKRKTPKKISKTYLENAALYYLQRYATSAENLRRVLLRKVKRSCAFHGQPEEEFIPLVDALVERYKTVGLLDDGGFARAKAASLRRQGLSGRAIMAKLQVKGLSPSQIEAALKTVDEEHEDAEAAAAAAYAKRKKLGIWRVRPADPQKELAAMARAGFGYDVAVRALKED